MVLHRSLVAALLVTASSGQVFAQTPAPPAPPATPAAAPAPTAAPAPAPLKPGPALTPLSGSTPANGAAAAPFKNASFEEPVVTKRTGVTKGGNPARIEETDWGHFIRRNGEGEGALDVGMTNEIARTGKQSIYLDFETIKGKRFSATLMTQLVPVQAKHPYKVGMWGRMDKARPLTLDQRRPYLRMEFEFYQQDEETQVGDTDYRVMQIPGSLKRLLFSSSRWNQAYGIVRAPEGAALMKVSYSFNIRSEPGETDGLIFFDDAFIQELPEDFPIDASDEIVVETTEDDEATATENADDAAKPATPPQ